MTTSDITPPSAVTTGHLVLTRELSDRISERLLGMLDSTTRRLERSRLDEENQPDPAELIEEAESIRSALVKLDAGYYGICESCEQPIPFERLDAIPSVRNCVPCQQPPRGLMG